MEKRVIIDDSCPTSAGEYTTYLFGEGAIGLGNGGAPVPTETDRDSLAGDDILINRKHYILHPRGVKWIGSAAGSSPTNAELATGTNWSRVYEDKAIRMVKFVHKL
ncbi:putative phage coat protein (fragment) [Clostridium neonatale]